MNEIVLLVWVLVSFVTVSTIMYFSLQALDFSKLFKANSTMQIKIILFIVSICTGIIVAFGLCGLFILFSKI